MGQQHSLIPGSCAPESQHGDKEACSFRQEYPATFEEEDEIILKVQKEVKLTDELFI